MKIKKFFCVYIVVCGMNFYGKILCVKIVKFDWFYYYVDKYFLKELNSICNFVNKILLVLLGRKLIKLII